MKLALLKGNRYNPWHLSAFAQLRGAPSVTAFRAESEVQQRFADRDDGEMTIPFEPIYYDKQVDNPLARGARGLPTCLS